MKILAIDDEPDLLEMYTLILNKAGHEIKTFDRGIDGYLDLVGVRYDLIISDLNMPTISGQELLKELQEGVNSDTPVLVISGHFTEEMRDQFDSVKIIYFLDKPFSKSQLLELIHQIEQEKQSA